MKVRAKQLLNDPWIPPYLCEDCLDDPNIPDGQEHIAEIQVHGRELCQFHIDQRRRPVEVRLGWDNSRQNKRK